MANPSPWLAVVNQGYASLRDSGCAPGLFVSSGDLPLLADSQSILQGGRHFESFNRLLNSVFLIGCLNRSEMFSPSADYIDAPAGHYDDPNLASALRPSSVIS